MATIISFHLFKFEHELLYDELESWQKKKALDEIRKKRNLSVPDAVRYAQHDCIFKCYKLRVKPIMGQMPSTLVAI